MGCAAAVLHGSVANYGKSERKPHVEPDGRYILSMQADQPMIIGCLASFIMKRAESLY